MVFVSKHFYSILLAAILLLGAFLRFYHLGQVPPGLWYDEAFYADEAMRVLEKGPRLIYYQFDSSQIGVFPAILAAAFWLFGDSLLVFRSTMASWGMLGLIGCYFMCLEIFYTSSHKKTIALMATFFLTTSYWHLNFSRVGFSSSPVPTIEIFAVFLTLSAFRTQQPRRAIIAGMVSTLGLYFYWSYYPFLLLPAYFAVYRFYQDGRKVAKVFAAYVLSGVLAALPLGWAFLNYDMFARFSSVSISNLREWSDITQLLQFFQATTQKIGLHIYMLFGEGDRNWRHNLSGQAELAPLVAIGVYVVMLLLVCTFIRYLVVKFSRCIMRQQQLAEASKLNVILTRDDVRALFFVITWAFLAMLPAVLSDEGLPHALRSISLVVPCQVLAAYGIMMLWQYLSNSKLLPIRLIAVILIIIAEIHTLSLAHQYFVVFANNPEAKIAFGLVDNAFLKHQFARDAVNFTR